MTVICLPYYIRRGICLFVYYIIFEDFYIVIFKLLFANNYSKSRSEKIFEFF